MHTAKAVCVTVSDISIEFTLSALVTLLLRLILALFLHHIVHYALATTPQHIRPTFIIVLL